MSTISPFDPSRFVKAATCLPCCAAPSECSCALLIPPFGGIPNYADYATAAAVVADPLQVSGCVGFCEHSPSGSPANTFTASFDGTTLQLDGTTDGNGALPGSRISHFWASVSLKAGSVLSVAFVITTDGTSQQNEIELLNCADGSSVGNDISTSASGTLTVIAPSDGEYIVHIGSQAGGTTIDATYVTATNAVTCDMTFWVNPVIALWDDSGTTRKLEACPMNVDPPCSSFSSLSAAEDELSSGNVVDCLGILAAESGVTINSASVSSGPPAVFNFNISNTGASSIANPTLSVGLDAGDTVVVSYNLVTNGLSGGGGAIFAEFLDTDCVQLDSSSFVFWGSPVVSPLTGTLVTFTAPYKGRFIIRCFVQSADSPASGTWDVSGSVTLTPSASMPVYPVTVAYLICTGVFPDITCLTCPAHLDCT